MRVGVGVRQQLCLQQIFMERFAPPVSSRLLGRCEHLADTDSSVCAREDGTLLNPLHDNDFLAGGGEMGERIRSFELGWFISRTARFMAAGPSSDDPVDPQHWTSNVHLVGI